MKIDNEFTVAAPIERAWAVLTDLGGIAPCLPGAVLTSREGDAYTGKVKVKVGPITTEYAGTATFAEKDQAAWRAVIDARGRDSRGVGTANALITAELRAEGDQTLVTASTDLKISGKIAQFGSGLIQDVSTRLLGQFAACLETKLAAATDEPVAAVDEPAADETDTAATAAATAGVNQRPAPAREPDAVDVLARSRATVAERAVPAIVGAALVAVVVYLVVR